MKTPFKTIPNNYQSVMWLTKTSVNKSFNFTSNIFYWFELFSFLQIWVFLKIQLPLDEGRLSRWNSEVVHPNLNYFWVVIFKRECYFWSRKISKMIFLCWTCIINSLLVQSLTSNLDQQCIFEQFWCTFKLFKCALLD